MPFCSRYHNALRREIFPPSELSHYPSMGIAFWSQATTLTTLYSLPRGSTHPLMMDTNSWPSFLIQDNSDGLVPFQSTLCDWLRPLMQLLLLPNPASLISLQVLFLRIHPDKLPANKSLVQTLFLGNPI